MMGKSHDAAGQELLGGTGWTGETSKQSPCAFVGTRQAKEHFPFMRQGMCLGDKQVPCMDGLGAFGNILSPPPSSPFGPFFLGLPGPWAM